jgi:tRNA (guanine-N7-)-methyltransferase
MPRRKLQRFQELNNLVNVAQLSQADHHQRLLDFLADNQPITLELGCGKGEYTLALAKKFPEKKFIGLDLQGERLWFGAKKALAEKLNNVFFLRIPAENLQRYFPKKSLRAIWLTFPDPYLPSKQAKKRLTSPRFLGIYKHLLETAGLVHLKTDNEKLFNYSLETIKNAGTKVVSKIEDLYQESITDEFLAIKTYYENLHLAKQAKIKYLSFKFK